MADNTEVGSGTGVKVASDKVTYSGDVDENIQLIRQVHVTGSEGSKTVVDLTGSTGATAPGGAVLCGGLSSGDGFLRPMKMDTAGAVCVGGDIAHDAADSGAPVKIGAKAIAHGTNPTAVAADERTNLYANRAGILFTIGGHPNVVTVKHANITTAVTNTAIVTVSAGTKIVVTSIAVTLDNASTVFPSVLIGFATATTPTTTGVLIAHGGVPAGGGIARGDGGGILGIGADDEDVRITTVGNATGNGLQVVVTYFTIPS